MSARTVYPVLLIHGSFGYGLKHPVWNLGPPYWPEQALAKINPNHIIVDVGALTSDHDRACEAFYELMGGTVDYGEEHARVTGHARFGQTYASGKHPNWSAENPIHIVGHSMGATTGIDLYQMLCVDAFGVGSDHRWVRSLTSIAGPLTGSTFSHAFIVEPETPWLSPARLFTVTASMWVALYRQLPWLSGLFDLRMEQWNQYSFRETISATGVVNRSKDMGKNSSLPSARIARNRELKWMHKLYLLSITTSPHHSYPTPYKSMLCAVVLICLGHKQYPRWWPRMLRATGHVRSVVMLMISVFLWKRMRSLNLARLPALSHTAWLTRRLMVSGSFDGLDPQHWQHNDGVVNTHSMLRPWFPSPNQLEVEAEPDSTTRLDEPEADTTEANGLRASPSSSSLGGESMIRCASHTSIDGFHHHDLERGFETSGNLVALATKTRTEPSLKQTTRVARPRPRQFDKGRWYVYRVDRNHFAGTYGDSEAPELYQSLFTMIAREFEDGASQQPLGSSTLTPNEPNSSSGSAALGV